MAKKTLVLGASPNPKRYSYLAVMSLREHGFDVVAIGKRGEKIADVPIQKTMIQIDDIHTVTLYLRDSRQKEYYDYIIGLKPKRIIFNPGTSNPELTQLAKSNGIETINACTLVMLSTGQF